MRSATARLLESAWLHYRWMGWRWIAAMVVIEMAIIWAYHTPTYQCWAQNAVWDIPESPYRTSVELVHGRFDLVDRSFEVGNLGPGMVWIGFLRPIEQLPQRRPEEREWEFLRVYEGQKVVVTADALRIDRDPSVQKNPVTGKHRSPEPGEFIGYATGERACGTLRILPRSPES